MTAEQTRLLDRVVEQFGAHVIDEHLAVWKELDDGRPCLWIDGGSTMFCLDGDNLHVTCPMPGGKVRCAVFGPDGQLVRTHDEPNPYGPEQASLN